MLRDGIDPARMRRARILVLLSTGILGLGQVALWLAIEPLATWSYDLSWWALIFLADAVTCLRTGSSLFLARPRAFLVLAFWSGAFWLVFECVNLRLQNWYYVGIPRDLATRTLGVYFAFATVLPGVLGIHTLLGAFASPHRRPPPRNAPSPRARALLTACGAAFLVLPLLFPSVAYPLIWGAPFLLLEPWLSTRDERSLLSRWRGGDRGPLYRLLLAGALCGAIWEFWNWRSPAKWIYTVPLFEEGKLFEMPYLGFVGFIPFALGCHSAARALVVLGWIPEWEGDGPPARAARPRPAIAAALASLVFSAVAIAGLNRFTVRATRAWLSDIPGIPAEVVSSLAQAGIRHPDELVRAIESGAPDLPAGLARSEWLETARLMSVRGLGVRGFTWLASAGVRSVEELGARDPAELERSMRESGRGLPPTPTPAEIRIWVHGARNASG
ncbi:MAG: DUF4332 domain-containing protein [Planctomycetota bacterium]